MRLSKLHIAGFKSFPDRAELGFDTGVTAIVGPNGCGKSNVVDAITWVLGEQSAKSLRGERMEDIIFNGSDARKPTGAAEVRLKLTQVAQAAMVAATGVDHLLDEVPLITRDVEIGRRLYRSGESEYLIDGEVCRLRDVHDLLMDSGLGVKAYAVIEQGKIGQILSSRPAERRTLIEEAAGVTKYKSRRRSAELKLEAAQQNLTRVDDIVFEVEKQRGALKRQAGRARRYKRLREELRTWEQVQFVRRHTALSRAIDAAQVSLDEARSREADAAAHVAAQEIALEAGRLGLMEGERAATNFREQAHAHELEIGRHQQQIQFDRHQIDELARQGEAFVQESRDLEARRGPATEALAAQREAAERAKLAQEAVTQHVRDREDEYNRALFSVQAVEQDADETRAAVMGAATTLSLLRQARDNAVAARDRMAITCERLEIEARDLATEAARAHEQHETAVRALAGARESHQTASVRRALVEASLLTRRADRDSAARRASARGRDLASAAARLRSLEQVEASRAIFGDAARLLLSESTSPVRHHGAVADHLIVERSYERAVEALLGDLLQHVLVEQTADATAGLALLSERGAGRCGFVVLEEAGSPRDADLPLVVPPGARALDGVVRATGPHASVIARLIERALITESFDAAHAMAGVVSVPVATMSGEVFRGSWLVQGGSGHGGGGILQNRAEVLSLREEVQTVQQDLETIASELSRLDADIATDDADLTTLVASLHGHEKSMVALEGQATRAADEHVRASRRLDVVRTERGRADDEQRMTEARRNEAAAAIEAHEVRQQEAEASLSGVLARLQGARDEAEGRMRLVTESRTEQAALIERVLSLDADVRRLIDAARDLDERIAARTADAERSERRRAELRMSVVETEGRLDAAVHTLDGLRQGMRAADEQVVTIRLEFNQRDLAIRAARHALDALRAGVTQLEVAHARAAADLAHLATACMDATGLALDEVIVLVAQMEASGELVAPARRLAAADAGGEDEGDSEASDMSDTAAAGDGEDAAGGLADAVTNPEHVIATLRRKIERLGPVNMMAIEQFDDLEARHTFLTTQRKDLLDAIAQTGEAIRKIDKTTRERFEQAFASVNLHFEQTFTTLFGGGRAGLVLIDQENDAESGIDIIAQPPGKRLQNVQLLSGGEKALTAMALMFAVFKYRPSPFCLLDEIDAPLDDANIGRFVEMLHGMQEHTQFILITHNRKTMEIANRLYGVTMEEPGVSKLISVQLN